MYLVQFADCTIVGVAIEANSWSSAEVQLKICKYTELRHNQSRQPVCAQSCMKQSYDKAVKAGITYELVLHKTRVARLSHDYSSI